MPKCRTIIYINKDDPRVFVYKHQKWKWMGVTLNFAHFASVPILLVSLGSAAIPLFPLLIYNAVAWSSILFAFWLAALVVYYFRQAAEDLERYPGNLSSRK